MKRLLTAACAIVGIAFAPGAASAQDASAPPSISLVHAIPGTTVDIVVDGSVVIDDVAPSTVADITSFAGRTLTDLEIVDVADDTTIVGPISSITVPNSGNWSIVAYLNASGSPTLGQFQNNLAELAEGTARLTVRHTAAASAVDLVVGDQRPIVNLTNGGSSELALPAGTLTGAQIAPNGEAPIATIADRELVANTNTVIYAVGSVDDSTLDFVVQVVALPTGDSATATTTTTAASSAATTAPAPSAVNTGSPIDGSGPSLALLAAVGGLVLAGVSIVARRRT